MSNTNYPTIADIEQAKKDMTDINKFIALSSESFNDNTGKTRLTLEGLIAATMEATGYVVAGTFSAGCTVTAYNQIVSDGVSYWRWGGALDKVVTAGSTPTPSGISSWNLVSDAVFKDSLAALGSTALVAGVQARAFRAIDGVKNLIPVENVMLNVASFYAGGDTGGGDFMYVPTMSKANHNGGTVIAPEALAAWDGTGTGISTLMNWTGTGNGCYVRKYTLKGYVPCSFFGASTAIPDNRLPVQKCLTAATAQSKIAFLEPSPNFYMFNNTLFIPSGGHLAGAGGRNKLTKLKRVNGHYTDLIMAGVHTEGVNGSYPEMVIPARNGMPYNSTGLGNDVKITGIYIDGNGINAGYAPELGSGTGYKGSNIYIRYVDGVTVDDLFSEYASNDCCYIQYCRRISVTNTVVARNKLTGNVIGATRNGMTVAGTLSGFGFPTSDFIHVDNITAEETEDLGVSVIFKTTADNPSSLCGTANISNIVTRKNATYGFAIEISGADSPEQPIRDMINISNILSVEDSQRTTESYGSVLIAYKTKNINVNNISIRGARSHGLILAGNQTINVSNVFVDGYGLGNWSSNMIGVFAYSVGGSPSKALNISNVQVSGGTGRTYDTYGVSLTGFDRINASNFDVDGNTSTSGTVIGAVNFDCNFLKTSNINVQNAATYGVITQVAKDLRINNMNVINSGQALVAGQRAGIYVRSGTNRTGSITGSNFSDYQTTKTQNIGIVLEASETDAISISESSAVGNTTQPIANLGMPNARIFNNSFPHTVPAEVNTPFSVGGIWKNGLRLGNSTLFVDETNWKVRVKLNGTPTSETDGVIVGTQT